MRKEAFPNNNSIWAKVKTISSFLKMSIYKFGHKSFVKFSPGDELRLFEMKIK